MQAYSVKVRLNLVLFHLVYIPFCQTVVGILHLSIGGKKQVTKGNVGKQQTTKFERFLVFARDEHARSKNVHQGIY